MLFSEFEGKAVSDLSAGDVKYHMGFVRRDDRRRPGASDPGVQPVTSRSSIRWSRVRCMPARPVVAKRQGRRSCPVLIHGDAAVAGQGVNQEMLNFAQTRGYGTGGTIHIVVNNQIGFTTSDPRDYRSSLYCTDIFKMVDAPIFHVNGDDPEAVAFVMGLAVEYRQEFKKDVVIDIVCFPQARPQRSRRADGDPAADVQEDRKHPGTRKLYADKLVRWAPSGRRAGPVHQDYRAALDKGELLTNPVCCPTSSASSPRTGARTSTWNYTDKCDTKVPMAEGASSSQVAHHHAGRLHAAPRVRRSSTTAGRWARASCPSTGAWAKTSPTPAGGAGFRRPHCPVRTSAAAPSSTATRRCTTRTATSGRRHLLPAAEHPRRSGAVLVYDSVLSEEAVLAFEYGYAPPSPTSW